MAKVDARKALERKIAALDRKIMQDKKKLVKLRKSLPPQRVKDYVFRTYDGKRLKLSQAFGRKQDLIVVHNMGRECPYCTLWADEMNGVLPHLEDRAGFLLTSPNEPKKQAAFRRSRGWKFRMASTEGTTFAKDMGFEPEPGQYWPGFTTFRKGKGGVVERVSSAWFGPGDEYCSVWHFFALLADGDGGWHPRFRYG